MKTQAESLENNNTYIYMSICTKNDTHNRTVIFATDAWPRLASEPREPASILEPGVTSSESPLTHYH